MDELITASVVPLGAARAIGDIKPNPDLILGTASVAVASVAMTPRWREILTAGPQTIFLQNCRGSADAVCASRLRQAFDKVARGGISTLVDLGLLQRVNSAANRAIRYQSDLTLYGLDDYWATPEEVALRGAGDCEDIAIAKIGMLEALGVPRDAMRLIIAKDLVRGIGHALVTVRVGERVYVLDSNADLVRDQGSVEGILPLYSLSGTQAWVHGIRTAPNVMIARY